MGAMRRVGAGLAAPRIFSYQTAARSSGARWSARNTPMTSSCCRQLLSRPSTMIRGLSSSADSVIVCGTPEDYAGAVDAAGDKLVVNYFTAAWCGPCKMVYPLFAELASAHADSAAFLKIDVDENEETAMEFGIRMMPTFVFTRNGEKIGEFSGADGGQLTSTVEALVKD